METSTLIQKFKDKNKIMENDMVLGMISYGSRVNNYAEDDSDLDILLITDGKYSYKAKQKIDGVIIDINIYSLDQIGYIVEEDRKNNNRYFVSTFNTGIIEKDANGIMEYLKDLINSRFRDVVGIRKLVRDKISEIGNLYQSFIIDMGSDVHRDYIYYNLLEKIRTNYSYMYNCSRLSYTKAYDVFLNSSLMNEYYQLKLPKGEFICIYMEALETKDFEARRKIIKKLLDFLNLTNFDLCGTTMYYRVGDETVDEIRFKIVCLKEQISKVEGMLINGHSASDSVYYILLYCIRDLLFLIDGDCALAIEGEFIEAYSAKDVDERIKRIEDLFAYIDKNFNLDYDNYLIKRY